MSGETQSNESGWTVDTLNAYLERMFHQIELRAVDSRDAVTAIMDERDLRYEQRFTGQQTALKDAFDAAKEAVNAALAAAKEATAKAETAADKRFDSTNEFRGQLADQAATFMPRIESEARNKALADRMDLAQALSLERLDTLNKLIAVHSSRLDLLAGKSTGLDAAWGYLVGIIGAIGGVVGLIVGLS